MKIKIKDVLELCCVLLQLDNVLVYLNGGDSLTEEQRQQAEKEANLLLKCANMVFDEIAAEYIHLNAVEKHTSADGRIPYQDFTLRPIDIYAVKQNGKYVPFKRLPDELVTYGGEVEIYFTYKHGKKEIGDNLDFDGRLSVRAAAYGTAAEYSLISGLYEESLIWDKRYKDCLFASLRSQKSVCLPQRSWI